MPENIGDVAKLARHRLHHDLLGVEDAIDHDAESLAADLGDDDEAIAGRLQLGLGRIGEPQQRLQVDQRQQLAAQTQHRRVLDVLDAVLLVARAHQLEHCELRNGEAIAARPRR